MAQEFTFTVNGVERTTTQNKPLLRYLRDDLHIHSAKDGCSEGACGTCTIHVDGAAVKACVLTTALAAGRNIVTVEGLPEDVREAFVYAFGAVGAVQCGFCIPGMVMAGAALIAEDPEPTEEQIKYAIRGNVCRCTGYKKIIEGISLAAAVLRGEKQMPAPCARSTRVPACSPSIPPRPRPCPAWWAFCAPRTCRSTRSATLSRTGTS